jgi:hypothetical protein
MTPRASVITATINATETPLPQANPPAIRRGSSCAPRRSASLKGMGHLWAISFPHSATWTLFAHKSSEFPWIVLLYVDKRARCGW